jgi:thioredoxin reductase (NADPH)
LSGSGVALDPKGFVLTGAEVGENRRSLETSRPGVYAIGDIRSGSIKRVAAAVGEGAQVVAALHAYLSPPHAAQTTPAAADAASTKRRLP